MKKRTLWLGLGFIFLSLWAISTVRGGIWLVIFGWMEVTLTWRLRSAGG